MSISPYLKILEKRRKLQIAPRRNKEAIEIIDKWLSCYRQLFPRSERKHLLSLALAGRAVTQHIFQTNLSAILVDSGRPMPTGDLIREFKQRGHLPSDQDADAILQIRRATKSGFLLHIPQLGYWLANQPFTKAARQESQKVKRNLSNRTATPSRHTPAGRGKRRSRSVSEAQLNRAEKLILKRSMTVSEIAIHLGISRTLLYYYFPMRRKPPSRRSR